MSIARPLARSLARPIAGRIAGGATDDSGTTFLFSRSGQSLALGAATGGTPVVVSTDTFENAKMLSASRPRTDDPRVINDNVNAFADRYAALIPLAESVNGVYGETYFSGMAAQNSGVPGLYTGIGRSAQSIANLSEGTRFFTDLVVCLSYGIKAIAASGNTPAWKQHLWAQGERDVIDNTDQATYLAALKQYRTDIIKWVNIHTGGSYAPDFFVYQPANPYDGTGYVNGYGPMDALLQFGLEEPYGYCIGPAYQMDYVDNAHMSSLSYRRFGEQIGKVIKRVRAGADWKPMHWSNATRTGDTISLTYHVPAGNLALDTETLPLRTNHGFEYDAAGITNVAVSGANSIEITLGAAVGGTLGYARTPTNNNAVGSPFGVFGNVRDSDTATAIHDDFPLFNWACHQQEVIS